MNQLNSRINKLKELGANQKSLFYNDHQCVEDPPENVARLMGVEGEIPNVFCEVRLKN
jgi:hypothetical protein